jgi:hypothetical protein
MDDLEAMARNFFGYGRWSAPYWFIGLEPGGSGNIERARAFKKLQIDNLCDCKSFHLDIGVKDWHGTNAKEQRTWRRLIMLLTSFRGEQKTTLDYQKEKWGMGDGETCIIELRGLTAKGLHIKVDRKKYLEERISTIRQKLTENTPKLVVMYGLTGRKHFEGIAGCKLLPGGIVEHQKIFFILADHPVRQRMGNTDDAWRRIGALARIRSGSAKLPQMQTELIGREWEYATISKYCQRIFNGTALALWERLNPLGLKKERA